MTSRGPAPTPMGSSEPPLYAAGPGAPVRTTQLGAERRHRDSDASSVLQVTEGDLFVLS